MFRITWFGINTIVTTIIILVFFITVRFVSTTISIPSTIAKLRVIPACIINPFNIHAATSILLLIHFLLSRIVETGSFTKKHVCAFVVGKR